MTASDAAAVDVITTAIYEAVLPLSALGTVEPRIIENALITAGLSLMIERIGTHAAADAVAAALISMRCRGPIRPPAGATDR